MKKEKMSKREKVVTNRIIKQIKEIRETIKPRYVDIRLLDDAADMTPEQLDILQQKADAIAEIAAGCRVKMAVDKVLDENARFLATMTEKANRDKPPGTITSVGDLSSPIIQKILFGETIEI